LLLTGDNELQGCALRMSKTVHSNAQVDCDVTSVKWSSVLREKFTIFSCRANDDEIA